MQFRWKHFVNLLSQTQWENDTMRECWDSLRFSFTIITLITVNRNEWVRMKCGRVDTAAWCPHNYTNCGGKCGHLSYCKQRKENRESENSSVWDTWDWEFNNTSKIARGARTRPLRQWEPKRMPKMADFRSRVLSILLERWRGMLIGRSIVGDWLIDRRWLAARSLISVVVSQPARCCGESECGGNRNYHIPKYSVILWRRHFL